MLNKGPRTTEAVRTLADILRRMQDHRRRKTPTVRPLTVAMRTPVVAAAADAGVS